MTARGFTLAELLITMVVLAILGTGLAQFIINNSRFVSQQDAMMEARESARAALNTMSFELRMAGDGALLMATRDSVTVRLPYAFGMACQTALATTVASLMPMDSQAYAAAVLGGLAWRGSTTGAYTVIAIGGVSPSTNTAACELLDSIRVVPGGWLVDINVTGVPAPSRPPYGSIFYLFQTVTYRFAASADLPGRIGLWRKASTAASEELVAPFDSSARFAFLMGPTMQVDERLSFGSQAARDSVRGLELRLVGASLYTPQGRSQPQTFDLRTSVAFLNRAK